MAYTKSNLAGEIINITTGTTGAGAAPSMPPYGLSVLSATSSEVFVLQAPSFPGQRKTLAFAGNSTANNPVVRLSTATGVVSFFNGATTGLTILTCAAARSTASCQVVELISVNTTSWMVLNVFPCTTTPTAANMGGGITLSS
jgi:hypothetical protein